MLYKNKALKALYIFLSLIYMKIFIAWFVYIQKIFLIILFVPFIKNIENTET